MVISYIDIYKRAVKELVNSNYSQEILDKHVLIFRWENNDKRRKETIQREYELIRELNLVENCN